MARQRVILQPGKFYHIYNRGINRCQIFTEPTNYEYFLKLYDKYISSIADTYAWVLMGNHFHLLVFIKLNPQGFENLEGIEKQTTQHFSNLFNAYTKAFNKMYQRTGSLFEHTCKRKLINHKEYLKKVILYIHNNPVHHGFCKHPIEYPWSSYLSCISQKNTKLQRNAVIDWFNGEKNFKNRHDEHMNRKEMDDWLELE